MFSGINNILLNIIYYYSNILQQLYTNNREMRYMDAITEERDIITK